MFKINLVPEVQEQKQKATKVNTTAISIAIGAVIVAGVALLVIGGIIATNKVLISTTNKNIAETQEEMTKYAELEKTVLSLEQGLAEAKKILNGNNAWTKLLPHLEAATPADVTYTRLSLEPGKVTASLTGKSVDSLARFVNSYKTYTVLVVRGTANAGDVVTVEMGGKTGTTTAKLDGSFVYAIKINPAENFTAKVKVGDDETTITYDSATKELSTSGGNVTADVKPLFSSITVNQYAKSDKVTFEATFNFDGGLIW